ncbi:MAG: isochorismatase family cysteine hydrolase [Chloroflexota bacterium]
MTNLWTTQSIMKPALLIIDPQNDFFSAGNPNAGSFEATIPVINQAIGLFRKRGWSIVFVQHTSNRLPARSQSWLIDERFDCRPTDTRISKTTGNAFWNTGLDSLLRSIRIDTVVISGYVAEQCVLSTLRGAEERGYQAVLLEGGIAGMDDRYTQFTMEISNRISTEGLLAA